MGSPKAELLLPELASYGTADQVALIAQPPASVIAGDSFGVVVAAENSQGGVDPGFNGKVTIALGANPGHSTLGGTTTVTAQDGIAVFDGLTLNELGTGYTLQFTSSFPTITTNPFNVISNPTPWQGTFYPVPIDASLRAAIQAADSNSYAYNTIELSASPYILTNSALGELLISNSSSLPQKTLTITGYGPTSSVIGSTFNWRNRIFEVTGSATHALSVVFQGLAIEGGNAQNAGAVGGNAALGGGLLIENAAVTLNNVFVQNNQAQGFQGITGAAGHTGGGAGGPGGVGHNASGGGIYLASGSLRLFGDTIRSNEALGGPGGEGGKGGGQGPQGAAGVTGGQGGAGGNGGNAAGGGVFAAGGAVVLANDTFNLNQVVGGPGGQGGVRWQRRARRADQDPAVVRQTRRSWRSGRRGRTCQRRRDLPRRRNPERKFSDIPVEFRDGSCGRSGWHRRAGHGRGCRNHSDLRRYWLGSWFDRPDRLDRTRRTGRERRAGR